jgi:hypothetical protein
VSGREKSVTAALIERVIREVESPSTPTVLEGTVAIEGQAAEEMERLVTVEVEELQALETVRTAAEQGAMVLLKVTAPDGSVFVVLQTDDSYKLNSYEHREEGSYGFSTLKQGGDLPELLRLLTESFERFYPVAEEE